LKTPRTIKSSDKVRAASKLSALKVVWAVWQPRCTSTLHWFWLKSGLAYISAKWTASGNKEERPTLTLWVVGLYFALFGFASQRYENHLDRLENKANILISQTGSAISRQAALSRIASLQHTKIPVQPMFYKPSTVFASLALEPGINKDNVQSLKDVMVSFKEKGLVNTELKGVNLERAPLKGADLKGTGLLEANLGAADLREADLTRANLWGANLAEADLSDAKLWGAFLLYADLTRVNFSGANLERAQLEGADLRGAALVEVNLKEANLSEADLEGANLWGASLINIHGLTCDQLKVALHWEAAFRDQQLACGSPRPSASP